MPVLVARKAPRSPRFESARVRTLADSMLLELGLADAELSVLLTDDTFMARLNEQHRGRRGPTDVLAFPMAGEEAAEDGSAGVGRLLGDVVISLDTAARQARARGHALLDEVTHLLAHGLLHLIGYDHQTRAEERRMTAQTERLVTAARRRATKKTLRPGMRDRV